MELLMYHNDFHTIKNLASDRSKALPLNWTQQRISSKHNEPLVNMSAEYEGQDPLVLAKQAERDLNSQGAKHGYSHDLSGMQDK